MNRRFTHLSRRELLAGVSAGFGYMALAGLATEAAAEQANPLAGKATHFPARAKRVIFCCMQGGPSHLDTFDYKPALDKDAGKELSADSAADRARGKVLPSPFKFTPAGESGLPISDVYPHLATHADKLCVINSMWTDVPNHPQAFLMLHTGEFRFARPSVGSWVLYGLGSENANLPGFVSINPPVNQGGAANYASGFLPAIYQGTAIAGNSNAPINNLSNKSLTREEQRAQLDLVQSMNQDLLSRKQVNTQLEGVIQSYELAFRMQTALPEVLDLKQESTATLQTYGIGTKSPTENFGRQCLMARRLAEAGVRYIEIQHGGWDQHNNLKEAITRNATATDQPMAALLADLEQRGMLKDTLVLWGGEFGRTPTGQGENGRNHNSAGYTMWLAGGGVKGGLRFGATDEYGKAAVENKVHPHDLHATMLHLMGLDHEKLTYYYGGRDYRLTGISGDARVVEEIL
jgi:hypothetical protein